MFSNYADFIRSKNMLFSATGVWHEATTFVGPSFSNATSTEQTLHALYGARFDHHKVLELFSQHNF